MSHSLPFTVRSVVPVTGLSNQEFLERYAKAGCVGLSGGTSPIDRLIARAERRLDPERRWSCWSHAFLFQGSRIDGHHWVIESDLHLARKHIRLGVQENRLNKFFNEDHYANIAVLDFGLSAEQTQLLLGLGLTLAAEKTRYSIRELLGTALALRKPRLRGEENRFAREETFYCSAFVQHLFREAGIDLAPGVAAKNTTPEDLSRTPVPHVAYVLQRVQPKSKLVAAVRRVKQRANVLARLRRRNREADKSTPE